MVEENEEREMHQSISPHPLTTHKHRVPYPAPGSR
jgi:hypothetical protein